jgi:tetratricopeptide (TPR) repeat protein
MSMRRRVLTIGGIALFAVVAAVALAFTLGARLPGDTITGRGRGSAGTTSNASERRALEAAVRRAPDSADAHRSLARFSLADKQYAKALEEFDAAARLAPADAESRAYAGWILFLVAGSAPADQQPQLLAAAVTRLDAAVAANPQYADAHFFRGMVRFRGQNDARGAVPEFQQYLVLAPQGPLADQVRSVLAQAVEAAKSQP